MLVFLEILSWYVGCWTMFFDYRYISHMYVSKKLKLLIWTTYIYIHRVLYMERFMPKKDIGSHSFGEWDGRGMFAYLTNPFNNGGRGTESSSGSGVPICFWGYPGKLRWNLKITQLRRKIIFQTSIFGFHVNFPGWILYQPKSVEGFSEASSWRLVSWFPEPAGLLMDITLQQLGWLIPETFADFTIPDDQFFPSTVSRVTQIQIL